MTHILESIIGGLIGGFATIGVTETYKAIRLRIFQRRVNRSLAEARRDYPNRSMTDVPLSQYRQGDSNEPREI